MPAAVILLPSRAAKLNTRHEIERYLLCPLAQLLPPRVLHSFRQLHSLQQRCRQQKQKLSLHPTHQ